MSVFVCKSFIFSTAQHCSPLEHIFPATIIFYTKTNDFERDYYFTGFNDFSYFDEFCKVWTILAQTLVPDLSNATHDQL